MNMYTRAPHNSSRADRPFNPGQRHRADFARQATISAFGWRFARALDQADFIDRAPGQLPGLSPFCLIEAQRPFPIQPKSKRTPTMTEQELTSLRTVIRFLWRDEQKNFEECELNDGEAPDDHIFSHLETLGRYVTREQGADVSPFI